MQKILNYLFIVLIFTVLQVTNVRAQDKMAPDTAIAVEQMEFHYDCGSSKYDEEARNACFTHERLKELQAKITDLEGQLLGAATAAKSMGDALNANHVEITALKATISDLEGKLANAVSNAVYDDAVRLYKEQQTQLTEANTKVSDLEGKLANAVLTEDAFKECNKRNNHNKATISILDENSKKLRQSGSCLKNKITDYASAIKVVPHSTPALESYRNDVVDELGIFIKSCE